MIMNRIRYFYIYRVYNMVVNTRRAMVERMRNLYRHLQKPPTIYFCFFFLVLRSSSIFFFKSTFSIIVLKTYLYVWKLPVTLSSFCLSIRTTYVFEYTKAHNQRNFFKTKCDSGRVIWITILYWTCNSRTICFFPLWCLLD